MIGIALTIRLRDVYFAYNPEPGDLPGCKLAGYSSMTTPDTLFELDMDTGELFYA